MRISLLSLFIILFPLAISAQDLNEDLWAAARKGDAQAVKTLLAKGADVNAKTRYGATALTYAADRGYLEIAKILVEHGAEVNAKDTFYGAPPITWASYNSHVEVVKYLLEKGAEGKDDVLMAGVENSSIDMVKAVLAVGGLSEETLTSALARATQGNKTEIVEALKAAGAVPAKVPDFKIDPALLQNYAGRYKNDDIGMEMTFTIQNDKFIGTVSGQPPLTYAPVDKNNVKAVEFSGIDITFNSTGNQVTDFTLKQGGAASFSKESKPKRNQPNRNLPKPRKKRRKLKQR
jgi:ankyrin repeat protein